MKKILYVISFVFLAVVASVHPSASADGQPLKGIVDSFGYGYEVSVTVNGIPVKSVKGDGQQATRLFAVDHPMLAQAPPDMQDLFILKEGENTIMVEFRKKGDSQNPLQVKLEVPDRYTKPLFHLTSSKLSSGRVERTFIIEKKEPPDFTTLAVTDENL